LSRGRAAKGCLSIKRGQKKGEDWEIEETRITGAPFFFGKKGHPTDMKKEAGSIDLVVADIEGGITSSASSYKRAQGGLQSGQRSL